MNHGFPTQVYGAAVTIPSPVSALHAIKLLHDGPGLERNRRVARKQAALEADSWIALR